MKTRQEWEEGRATDPDAYGWNDHDSVGCYLCFWQSPITTIEEVEAKIVAHLAMEHGGTKPLFRRDLETGKLTRIP
jgi:hypothetical protein